MRRAPASQVDVVDPAHERHGVLDPELAVPVHEGPDVLGEAAAAEPDADVEELATNADVVPDRVGEGHHVGTDHAAQVADGVDKGDLGTRQTPSRGAATR